MSTSQLASRVGAVALCVGLSAAPWIRVLGDCPGPAAPTPGHEAYASDCPCAPKGGYVYCKYHGEAECEKNEGDVVSLDNWECKTGNAKNQCIYGISKLCWKMHPCKWVDEPAPGKCSTDSTKTLDQASYVVKKTVPSGSGSGS